MFVSGEVIVPGPNPFECRQERILNSSYSFPMEI